MSPHAVLPPASQSQLTEELRRFQVTRNAFLPDQIPCFSLSDPYYEPWETLAQDLPNHIGNLTIRSRVQQLPILSPSRLASTSEWRRAYVILAFLTHAYIWGDERPAEVLPPQIAVPFLRISSHLELPPVLTYAGANLWNFTSSTPSNFSSIENLQTLVSFTGTASESWFLLISVTMEAQAANIIPVMMKALEAVKRRDYQTIVRGLNELRECIDSVAALLERMYERCDPQVFYHHIRPFLAGSKNMEAAGLPRGVFYDEGDGKGRWRQLRGGSNGQSSLIQFFDVVLGVSHTSHGSKGEKSYHDEVREYMPGPHRRFLVHVARMGSIRELAMSAGDHGSHAELRAAYTAATQALGRFRDKHIQIVTKYIILPSRMAASGQPTAISKDVGRQVTVRKNLASSSTRKNDSQGLVGTGGTPLVPFLKQSRDETTIASTLRK